MAFGPLCILSLPRPPSVSRALSRVSIDLHSRALAPPIILIQSLRQAREGWMGFDASGEEGRFIWRYVVIVSIRISVAARLGCEHSHRDRSSFPARQVIATASLTRRTIR